MKQKNRAAAELGRRGGKARAKKLSKEERTEQARKAVQARWEKYRAAKTGSGGAELVRKRRKKTGANR